MDEKGFLDCNSAALQMFGYSAGAPMLHPADISPPNQPDGTNSRIDSRTEDCRGVSQWQGTFRVVAPAQKRQCVSG
jgi:hypothetical protein